VVGREQTFTSPFGVQKIIYADWTASGRIYKGIEDKLNQEIFPFVANTHTETSTTGAIMSLAFYEAIHIIKHHIGANDNDILISGGAGMTMLVNKFQRILGLKIHEKYGIQVSGGCSCAGTYGHILFNVKIDQSCNITTKINDGNLTSKPGWVRMSIHPTMTDDEIYYIMNAIEDVAKNHKKLGKDYKYNEASNEFRYKGRYICTKE